MPTLSLLVFFVIVCDGISLLLQRYVRKGNDAKKPAILGFFFVIERTQLNATHAQLLKNLRQSAFLWLMLETSASESLYGGQFTLIKPNYLVILPTNVGPQFL